jgi:DNA N-6-adenine-methyltransferase (Dam)
MDTSFERVENGKIEWLTPPEIIKSLGEFDLDPCSPINRPWPTAKNHFTEDDDGFNKDWNGRVWCNPPYGNQTGRWLKRCMDHGNSIAIIFARTETKMFFDYVWNGADALFFFKGRLKFYHVDGTQAGSAGAPSVLVAYGENNANILKNFPFQGKFISLK